MTVNELIQALQSLPDQNLPITIHECDLYGETEKSREVTSIRYGAWGGVYELMCGENNG